MFKKHKSYSKEKPEVKKTFNEPKIPTKWVPQRPEPTTTPVKECECCKEGCPCCTHKSGTIGHRCECLCHS